MSTGSSLGGHVVSAGGGQLEDDQAGESSAPGDKHAPQHTHRQFPEGDHILQTKLRELVSFWQYNIIRAVIAAVNTISLLFVVIPPTVRDSLTYVTLQG